MYLGPGKLKMQEIPMPKPAEDEIMVKVRCATTCGTDLKTYKRGYHLLNPPCRFGHEFAGDIVEVGAAVKNFTPGMRVVAHNSAPCNRCFYCKHGQHNLCENLIFNLGAFAEYITVPGPIVDLNTFLIPDHVSYAQAAIIEPLTCVVHGHRLLQIQHGERAAVYGVGPIGLMHVQLCRLSGSVQIIAVDVSDARLDIAKTLGATDTVNSRMEDPVESIRRLTGGRGVDVAIEAAGTVEAWHTAVQSVRKGGRVEFFGGLEGHTSFELDSHRMHYEELTLYAAFHGTPLDAQHAYQLIVSGAVDVQSLISDELPLENVEQALLRMATGEAIKIAINPELRPD
jgi:L-iditol 2-dehydrogenase